VGEIKGGLEEASEKKERQQLNRSLIEFSIFEWDAYVRCSLQYVNTAGIDEGFLFRSFV